MPRKATLFTCQALADGSGKSEFTIGARQSKTVTLSMVMSACEAFCPKSTASSRPPG